MSQLFTSPVFMGGQRSVALYDAITAAALTSSLKLVLDAGDSASYSSGQKWLDRSGGGYDFFVGSDATVTTDDPTFNGVAGGLSSNEYWSFDGGDFFRYDTTNETWMEALHKDSAVWSFLAGVYVNGAAQHGLFGTSGGSSTNRGVYAEIDSSRKMRLDVHDGSGAAAFSKIGDTALGDGWHIVGGALDEPTGAGAGFWYADGAYNQVSAANTFDATYATPSASAATYAMEVAAIGNAAVPMANGGRIAFAAIWQGVALTKANFDALFSLMRGRLGL